MNRNYEELAEWCSDARRGLEREVEHLQEKQEQMTNYMRALSATEELSSQLGDLNEELERKQAENDRLSDVCCWSNSLQRQRRSPRRFTTTSKGAARPRCLTIR